jgi:hypothetical protein
MTIAFSCVSCGHVIRVGDQFAGKRGKCPKCHTTMTVPLPSAAPPPIPSVPLAAAAPARPAADPNDPFANFGTGGDEPLIRLPRRRRSKVKSFVVFVIVLVLLGGGGYFAYYYFFGVAAGLTEEERYFPSGVKFVASARPTRLFASGSWKDVKAAIAPAATAESMAAPVSPVPLNQVERITFAGNLEKELVFLVRSTKALAVADVQKGLSEMRPGGTPKFKEVKVGNYTMYESDGAAFCLVSSRLLVASTEKTLKGILERDRKPDFPADFQTAFKAADFSKTFACAAGCKDAGRESGKPGANLFFVPHRFRDEIEVSGVSDLVQSGAVDGIALDVDVGSDVTAKVSVFCKDAKMAEEMRKGAEEGLAKAKIEAKETDLPKEILEIANSIKVSAIERTFGANATIKVGPLLKAAKEAWLRNQ